MSQFSRREFLQFLGVTASVGARTVDASLQEQRAVGASLLRVRRRGDGAWEWLRNDVLNRRLDGTSPIPFASRAPIAGASIAIGTMANCAGGTTPWRTEAWSPDSPRRPKKLWLASVLRPLSDPLWLGGGGGSLARPRVNVGKGDYLGFGNNG